MIPVPLQVGHGVRSRFGETSKRFDFSTKVAKIHSWRSSLFASNHHPSRVGGFGASIWAPPPPPPFGAGLLPPDGGLIFGGSTMNDPDPYLANDHCRFGRPSQNVFVSSAVTTASFAWNCFVSSS